MKNFLKALGAVLVILCVILLLTKDLLVKAIAPSVAANILGAPVEMGDFSLSLIKSRLVIQDLKVGSPEGFGPEPMLDLARVEVVYDLPTLLNHRNHFTKIDIDVRHVLLVKNASGKFNAQALKPVENSKKDESKAPVNFSVDTLAINVDHVFIKDKVDAQARDINIGMHHRTYTNINSVNDLIVKVVASEAGLLSVTNTVFFAGHELKKGVGLLMNTTEDVVSKAGGLLKKIAAPLLK